MAELLDLKPNNRRALSNEDVVLAFKDCEEEGDEEYECEDDDDDVEIEGSSCGKAKESSKGNAGLIDERRVSLLLLGNGIRFTIQFAILVSVAKASLLLLEVEVGIISIFPNALSVREFVDCDDVSLDDALGLSCISTRLPIALFTSCHPKDDSVETKEGEPAEFSASGCSGSAADVDDFFDFGSEVKPEPPRRAQ